MYLIFLGIKNKKFVYFLLAGGCFGIAIQLHYLALILFILSSVIILIGTNFKTWVKYASAIIFGSIITFSPFLIFEAYHEFPNFKTILEFITRGSTVGIKHFNIVWLASNTGNIFLEYLSGFQGTIITKISFWLLTSIGIISSLMLKKKLKPFSIIATVWFIGGLLGLRLYTGSLNDYYFGFMFPAPFLIGGLSIYLAWQYKVLKVISIILATALFLFFIKEKSIFSSPPNRLINQTETIADFIIEKSTGDPFNFALISSSNSDHAYRYFLDLKGNKPVKLEDNITSQLLIICESKKCSPLGNPLWEIAAFGRGEIVGEWDLPKYGFKVYRLIHWPGEPSPEGKPAVKGI